MFHLLFRSGHSFGKHIGPEEDGDMLDRSTLRSSWFRGRTTASPSSDWLGWRLYAATISRIYKAWLRRGMIFREDSAGICCFDVHSDRRKVAAVLAKCLRTRKYHPGQPHERLVRIGGKMRRIFSYSMLDTIFQSAIYRCLSLEAERHLSKNVYGYLQGRSAQQAIGKLCGYLNAPNQRASYGDVYVLRMDVKSYSDSIPCGAHSMVWSYLDALVGGLPHAHLHGYLRSLVWHTLRPISASDEGAPYQRIVGMPTGSPLNNLACFVYLQKLDSELERIQGSFYVRYGDDIVFAHTNASSFFEGIQQVETILSMLSLQRNVDKEQVYYLSRPGRPVTREGLANAESIAIEIKGAEKINYLGHVVRAGGRTSMSVRQINAFTHRIFQRAVDSAHLVRELETEARGHALCRAINHALTLDDPLVDKKLKAILMATSDRDVLKQIDYLIALKIAELVSGWRGVRAWRKISYRKIRRCWGLVSLCHAKNRITTFKEDNTAGGFATSHSRHVHSSINELSRRNRD